MRNYYVTPKLLRRARRWSEVKTCVIGVLIMVCAFLTFKVAVHQMIGVNLRGNMAALCEVSDRPPMWLWLGGVE